MRFEGERLPVVAIADDTIIAYRYNRKYLEEKNGDKTYQYSNCFVLIQHDYTTPKGQKLTFYSHYNHLSPWDELITWIRDNEQLPNIIVKPGYRINKEGLLLRSSPEINDGTHHNRVGSLKRGQDVIATPVNDHPECAKKEGVNEYFCYEHNLANAKPIVCEPQFDQIVSTCELSIKAGSIVGYSGLCEAEGAPPNYTLAHVEVFASDDAEEFVKNPKGDGKPTQIKITAPKRELFRRDKLYPDITEIKTIARGMGTIVNIKDKSNENWIEVEDKKFVATVSRDWLDYANNLYTAKAEYVDLIDDKFPTDIHITSDTKFSLVKKHVNDRVISVDAPNPKVYWIKRSLLGSNNTLKETSDDCYMNNPDAASYTSIGTAPYDCTASSQAISHDEGVTWHQVDAEGIKGWIKESDITKVSPYDWLGCGFSLIKEEDKDKSIWRDHSKTEDSRIDIECVPEPFKSIFNAIDTTPDGKISQVELLTAMADPATSYKLSRLICRHQTEWWYDDGLPPYKEIIERVKDLFGEKSADNLKSRIEQMCWWNDVSELPPRVVYHWHPLAFVEHINDLEEFSWAKTPFADLITKFESRSDYSAYNKTIWINGEKKTKSFFNTELATLTISEIQSKQRSRDMLAVGKYQCIPGTLAEAIQYLAIDEKEIFSEKIQDKIFSEYLIIKKQGGKIIEYLEHEGDLEEAVYAAAKEWASVGVRAKRLISDGRVAKGGESYYEGDGLNSALITPDEIAKALQESKKMRSVS